MHTKRQQNVNQEQQVIKGKSYRKRPTKNQSIELNNHKIQIMLPNT